MSETNLKSWHENVIYLEDISKLGAVVKQLEEQNINFEVDVNGIDRRSSYSQNREIIVITITGV
jgi:hypothetical protein